MANKKLDDDLDLGIEKEAGSKKKMIILIVVGVVVLLGGGLGVGWFMLGGESADWEESVEAEAASAEAEKGPPIYLSLAPAFVVNLPPGGQARMLQLGVDVMARQPELIEFLKHNDPMIRNNLLNLFGTQDSDSLRAREGKEKLQAEVLKALNKIIKGQDGPGEVEAVYFTSFVMQ